MKQKSKKYNPIISSVNYWTIFLVIIILISPATIDLLEFMPALTLIVLTSMLINMGKNISIQIPQRQYYSFYKLEESYTHLFILTISSIAASFYTGYFYTGTLPTELLNITLNSMSAYERFQTHNSENNLSSFGINQIIPFILSLFNRAWFFYALYLCIIRKKYTGIKKYTLITLSSFAFLYYGLVRGTTVEFFEFAIYIFISNTYAKKLYPSENSNKLTTHIVTFILIASSFSIFYYNQSARSESISLTECITNELCFNESSLIHNKNSVISIMLFKLNAYFSFGIFFLTKYISTVYSSDWGSLAGIIPINILAPDSARKMVCGKVIDCGAAWIPDIVSLIAFLGFPLSLTLFAIIGLACRILHTGFLKNLYFDYFLICYYITLQLMSFFSGNFIMSNQSSQGVALLAIFSIILRTFKTILTK